MFKKLWLDKDNQQPRFQQWNKVQRLFRKEVESKRSRNGELGKPKRYSLNYTVTYRNEVAIRCNTLELVIEVSEDKSEEAEVALKSILEESLNVFLTTISAASSGSISNCWSK